MPIPRSKAYGCEPHASAGVPIAKIVKIVGWSPATMVRMSYGHFSLEDLRGAVETISRPAECEIDQGPPGKSPGYERLCKCES
jgi:hypothetical protein